MTLARAKIPILGPREEKSQMRPGSPWSDVRLGKLGEPGNRRVHGHRKYKGVRCPKRLAARYYYYRAAWQLLALGRWHKVVISPLSWLSGPGKSRRVSVWLEPGVMIYRKRSGEGVLHVEAPNCRWG